MERILTQDERIRRAEEIYARRQNLRERTKKARLNVSDEPKKFVMLKRLILQAIICVLIYFIFYLINTTNYSFSEVTLSKTEKMIKQDTDFVQIYNNIVNWVNSYLPSYDNSEENEIQENEVENIVTNEIENTVGSLSENIIENVITQEAVVETVAIPEEISTFILPLKRNRYI